MEDDTDSGITGYHNISNCFFMQRGVEGSRANNSNNYGMTGWMAMRLVCKGSTIDNISILSNTAPPAWTTNKLYRVGNSVQADGKIYECDTEGTSASSGSGPSGTGSNIADGTTRWDHVKTALANACTVDAGTDGNRGILILEGSHNHISNITAHRTGTSVYTAAGTDNFITGVATNTSATNGTVTTVTPDAATDIILGDIEGGDDSVISSKAVRHVFKTQGGEQFRIINGASPTVNTLEVFGSNSTVNALTLRAKDLSGSNPNQDVRFLPIGTGKVRFGTHAALGGASLSGYIEIKDAAGNTRKLGVVS
jgi:hypothetical protein